MSQMPDKIWLHRDTKYNTTDEVFGYQYESAQEIQSEGIENFIKYVPLDAFIDRVINYLNYKLDDVVAIRVPGTIIPHHVAKKELIDDLENYMKGE